MENIMNMINPWYNFTHTALYNNAKTEQKKLDMSLLILTN